MNDNKPPARGKPTRAEKQAYRWVANMIEDPDRHGPALARWLARDAARLDLYNRVAQNLNAATWDAAHAPFPSRVRPWSLRSSWVPVGFTLAGAAGAALLYCGVGTWFSDATNVYRPSPPPALSELAYDNPAAGPRIVGLPDRSNVTLAPQSRIELHFNQGERNVLLVRGRARFDVAHDALRPFNVFAGGGRITAVGTLFDVEVGPTIKVHLLRGAIDVASPAPFDVTAQAHATRLTAGGETSFTPAPGSAANEPTKLAAVEHLPDAASSAGLRTFDDMTLEAIAAQVSQASGIQMRIDNPVVARQRAFVDLDPSNGHAAAQQLATLFHLDVYETAPGVVTLGTPDAR